LIQLNQVLIQLDQVLIYLSGFMPVAWAEFMKFAVVFVKAEDVVTNLKALSAGYRAEKGEPCR
jgi:hypothetical protein